MTYNHGPYIEECLQSILRQKTNFAFDVLVGDDCSTDGASEVIDRIAEADPRVRVLRPRRNMGATQNLMSLHNAASGEYVCYLDGDDLTCAGKLQRQVEFLDAHPDLVLCGHQMRVIDENGREDGRVYPITPQQGFDLRTIIRRGLPVFPSSLMYRRAARTLTQVDFDIYDWYMFTDILQQGDAGYIHEMLGAYRIHSGSMISRDGEQMTHRMMGLYQRRLKELPQYRADFMAYGLKIGWEWWCAKRRIPLSVLTLIWRSFTPTGFVAALDAYEWTKANGIGDAR